MLFTSNGSSRTENPGTNIWTGGGSSTTVSVFWMRDKFCALSRELAAKEIANHASARLHLWLLLPMNQASMREICSNPGRDNRFKLRATLCRFYSALQHGFCRSPDQLREVRRHDLFRTHFLPNRFTIGNSGMTSTDPASQFTVTVVPSAK